MDCNMEEWEHGSIVQCHLQIFWDGRSINFCKGLIKLSCIIIITFVKQNNNNKRPTTCIAASLLQAKEKLKDVSNGHSHWPVYLSLGSSHTPPRRPCRRTPRWRRWRWTWWTAACCPSCTWSPCSSWSCRLRPASFVLCRGTCTQGTPEIHSQVFKMCYSVSLYLYTRYAWNPQCSV